MLLSYSECIALCNIKMKISKCHRGSFLLKDKTMQTIPLRTRTDACLLEGVFITLVTAQYLQYVMCCAIYSSCTHLAVYILGNISQLDG